MTYRLPPYLAAAAAELHDILSSAPFIDGTLSVRVQDGRPVHVEISSTTKRKPADLISTGKTGVNNEAPKL